MPEEPQDYTNSHKSKEKAVQPEKKEKDLTPVVTGEVIVKKKGVGRKFKDLFVEADFRSVARYVVSEVLFPAFQNMVVDATRSGVERMMYGESAVRRRNFGSGANTGPRYSYNTSSSPLSGQRDPYPPRRPPAASLPRGSALSRRSSDDIILTSREEANLVLERMNDILDQYHVVTVAELLEILDRPHTFTDQQWGWEYLGDARVRQVREGYLIDFPPAMSI